MNWKQKICLWIGIIIIVIMGIYPPTHRGFIFPKTGWYRSAGGALYDSEKLQLLEQYPNYAFLLNLPPSQIAVRKLFVQWAMVAVVTGGLIYTFRDKRPKDEQK